MMKISEYGVEFIKKHEGIRLLPYNDGGGYATIGYGHLIGEDEGELHQGISEAEADEMLKFDLHKAEAAVNNAVDVELDQMQFDALVSFAFNVGGDRFASSTLVKLLNKGMYEEVPKQLMRWTKSNGRELPGLVKRRRAEGAMFAS